MLWPKFSSSKKALFFHCEALQGGGHANNNDYQSNVPENYLVKNQPVLGNGPNTVSGSTVSNTELSEFFWAH